MKTDIPYARDLIVGVIKRGNLNYDDSVALLDALVMMTRHPTKHGARRNYMDKGLRARVVAELARDDTRHDVEIALAAGFKTAAGAARVSEIRNGVR